jgi:hypothetical protein
VLTDRGEVLTVPASWALLPPGDAGLTRRVKAAGPTWTVQEQVGRRTVSRGVWAERSTIDAARQALELERTHPAYQKKLAAARGRREHKQQAYVEDFRSAVLAFLAFHPRYAALAQDLADAVTKHATPVGSGTVARTQLIPIDERAARAVIAWMRHQTTSYDDLGGCVRGRRRVRRMLAQSSLRLLEAYRSGLPPANCPLARALGGAKPAFRSAEVDRGARF